ncbi:hypothetical protein P5V15_014974 [Pogonomyrmex californicus]
MTAILVSVAELSNIFSVLAVLICFCGVFLFIMRNMMVLRVHGDDLMFGGGGGGVITHSPRIPQMEMMKVHIPFTFKLHESFKSTYAEIRSLSPFCVSPFFFSFTSFSRLFFVRKTLLINNRKYRRVTNSWKIPHVSPTGSPIDI